MSDTDMKVLLFDIETSLAQVYTYGLYDQNISILLSLSSRSEM